MWNTVISLIFMYCDAVLMSYIIRVILYDNNIIKAMEFITAVYIPMPFKVSIISDVSSQSQADAILYTMFPFILITLLLVVIYKVKIINSVIITVMYTIISVLTQIICAGCLITLTKLFNINVEDALFYNIVQVFYMLLTFALVKKFKFRIHKIYKDIEIYINGKAVKYVKRLKLAASTGLMAILMGISIFAYIKVGVFKDSFVLLLFIVALMIMILVVSYYEVIINSYKLKQVEDRARLDSIHQDFVRTINNFGHSYNNLMQTISFFVNCEDIDVKDLREVLKEIVYWNDSNKINHKLKYINIPNVVIASLLSIKLDYAEQLGVTLKVRANGSAKVNINSKDFIDILDVLLDNAIEAAHFAENKIVEIDLDFSEERFKLRISNHCIRGSDGKTKKYGESKNIGLKSVESIVNNNDNIFMSRETDSDIYTVTIEILNNKQGE